MRPPIIRRTIIAAGLALLAAGLGSSNSAAQGFPTHPVRIVIPFAAGGTMDVIARRMAELMRSRWNQPVIVENRPGGGTIVATQFVARAPADGLTMLLTDFSLATNDVLYRTLPYQLEQLAPVTTLVTWPLGVVVNTNLGVDTLAEFAALSHRRQLNYGSFGPGTAPHLAMELFKAQSSADVLHIPYSGIAPVLLAMSADTVHASVMGILAAMPGIERGTMRMLAVDERSALLPDVPSFADAGFPAMRAPAWSGVVVPAGTDAAIVVELNRAIAAALKEPGLRAFLIQGGYTPVGDSPADFGTRIRATIELWRPIARAAGIQLN
jgi:tripartite-type tricarboxylate transporter receptor subunit TctC